MEECGRVGLWEDEERAAGCVTDSHSELVGSEGWGSKGSMEFSWKRTLLRSWAARALSTSNHSRLI